MPKSNVGTRRWYVGIVAWWAVALVLSAWAFASFTAALLTVLVVPIAGIASIAVGVKGFLDKDRRNAPWHLVRFLALAWLAASFVLGPGWLFHRVRSELAPVVAAVEQYRHDRGELPPDDLVHGLAPALVPAYLPSLPLCPGGRPREPLYWTRDGEFSLTCMTVVFLKYTYESKTGEWHAWD